MGYVCPVCGDPQPDAEHLANHVAMSAIISGDDHEAYLDERVDDWGGMGPDDLGPILAEGAEEIDLDLDDQDHGRHAATAVEEPPDPSSLSADDRAVLEAARDLTRRMYEERAADIADGSDGTGADADGSDSENE